LDHAGFFQAGGTLSADSLSYLERAADRDLIDALAEGRFVFILDSRQKGKSSVVGHALSVLQKRGTRIVRVDLQRLGSNLDVEKWYAGILNVIGRDLGVAADLFTLWKERLDLGAHARFMEVLELGILDRVEEDIVVMIDEIDFVRSLPFETDEFFAGIRECFNRRAAEPKFCRLTFCLVGVASASQLIDNPETTPFNVGDRIELNDFSRWELRPYEVPLSTHERHGASLLDRVYHWVNGHPYLTQLLCRWIAEDETYRTSKDVDRLVEAQFLSAESRQREPNLADVERRLLKPYIPGTDSTEATALVLDAYRQVLGKGLPSRSVRDDVATVLKLSGAVVEERDRLVSRNRLYARLFGPSFVESAIPRGEAERIRLATKRAKLRVSLAASIAVLTLGLIAGTFAVLARDRNIALSESRQVARRAADEAYRTSMLLASREAFDGAWPTVRELIESQAEYPERGWEWRYWHHRLTRAKVVLPAEPGPGFSRVWVEDGHIIRRRENEFYIDREGPFRVRNFQIAMESAYLLERTIGKGAIKERAKRADRIAELTDGQAVAIAALTGPILLRDPSDERSIEFLDATGKRRYRHPEAIRRAEFSGTDVVLVADGRVTRLDWTTATELWTVSVPGTPVATVSTELSRVVLESNHFGLAVLDLSSGRSVARAPGLTSTPVMVRVLPDLDRAIVSYQNGALLVYDTRTWQPITELDDHVRPVIGLWRDGDRLLSMDSTGEVLSRPTSSLIASDSIALGAGELQSLVISPDGSRLVASSINGKVILLDAKSLQRIRTFEPGRIPSRHDMAFSPDGRQLLYVTPSGVLHIVESESGTPVQTFAAFPYLSARFRPGGGLAATTRQGKLIRIGEDGTEAKVSLDFLASSLAFSSEGNVAVRGFRGEVALFDRRFGLLRQLPAAASPSMVPHLTVYPIEWSSDGRLAAIPTPDRTVRLVGIDEADDRTLGPFESRLWEAKFSPDGSLLLVNGFDLRPSLWDTGTGKRIASFLHGGWVAGACFSADGSRIATACEDGTTRVWDLQGHELARLTKTPRPMFDVVFSPDHRTLFASGTDGIVRAFVAGK